MSTGICPSQWSKGIIVTLHRKENVDCVYNYMGVLLMDTFKKIPTSVLNI